MAGEVNGSTLAVFISKFKPKVIELNGFQNSNQFILFANKMIDLRDQVPCACAQLPIFK